jgi:hypothetical protein
MELERTGQIFGWLFIGTFVTSIPARLLFIHGVGASWSNMWPRASWSPCSPRSA